MSRRMFTSCSPLPNRTPFSSLNASNPGKCARHIFVHRQVAQPATQDLPHVAQDVHKLQPLAEPHAIFLAQRFQSRQVRPAYLRPRLADATRDEVRITVEFEL